MTKQTTKSKLAELKKLAGHAGELLYKRVRLAAEVLADGAWIEEAFDGDDMKAHDAVAEQYFGDLGGLMTVGEMIAIYHQFPEQAVWQTNRYNLCALDIEYHKQVAVDEDAEAKPERISWKTKTAEVIAEKNHVEAEAQRLRAAADSQSTELAALRSRVKELEADNAMLRGRLEELQRIMDRQFDKVS